MNIKILDSWLREYVKTSATPKKIGELLSLSSVGVERIEKYNDDIVYDIEITTNRPDFMSVVGLAREVATVLPQNGIAATYVEPTFALPKTYNKNTPEFTIKTDEKLTKRIMAIVMEITIKESPQYVKERLESSGIRSLNNVIDITNYVMREIGHPTHVFDYDRLGTRINIRESRKGESLTTLDGKTYKLTGGDIVADNGKGEIIDLIGIMGTVNSVVTHATKRILFFIESVEPTHIRKTSMEHSIRTEAAVLNEKGLNSERVQDAFARGIQLFEKLAGGKIIGNIIDMYPKPPKATSITLTKDKMDAVIGVEISLKQATQILTNLGFGVREENAKLLVTVPPEKTGDDMQIPEDLIEEIARIYGYHNIPNELPVFAQTTTFKPEKNEFYWEDRIKDTLKYWGFTEVYTYSMVSEKLYDGDAANAVTIANQLSDDMVYMRRTLIPSLLEVIQANRDHDEIKLFEIANVYEKQMHDLPMQTMHLAGVIKKANVSFLEMKGIIEQLLEDQGIKNITFKHLADRYGAEFFVYSHPRGGRPSTDGHDSSGVETLGTIETLNESTVAFEINFALILEYVSLKKTFTPISKFPPVIEDLALIALTTVTTGELIETIAKQSPLITSVTLLDKYQDTRTFHIIYQSYEKNLTDNEVGEIRGKILTTLQDKFGTRLKR